MLRFALFEIIFLTTNAYALWKGGTPERIAAATFLIAATLTDFVHIQSRGPLASLDGGVMIVDMAVLTVMLALAILSERFWTLWMAAMAGITALTHLSVLSRADLAAWAYWQSEALWSYPMQLLLAVATLRHRQRLKMRGADPSWKRSYVR